MQSAPVPDGSHVRWIEIPGDARRTRVFLHGLGASSAAYFAAAAAHPALAGPRSLLLDFPGFGISDRPRDFDYTLEGHADRVAVALETAVDDPVDLVAHSMGGSIGIVLAASRPELVSSLVLVDANLDPLTPEPGASSSRGIAAYTEDDYVAAPDDELRALLGDDWWATMRWADRAAAHRSATSLISARTPSLREQLMSLLIPRTFLYPAADGEPDATDDLRAAGVAVVPVPDCGHNIMIDNVEQFALLTAAALTGRLLPPHRSTW